MDDYKPTNFREWVNSPLTNGYCFKSTLRLVPGPNDCFYWKPNGKPVNGQSYVSARVFNVVNNRLVPTEHSVELSRVLFENDLAVKLKE